MVRPKMFFVYFSASGDVSARSIGCPLLWHGWYWIFYHLHVGGGLRCLCRGGGSVAIDTEVGGGGDDTKF